MAPSRPNKSSTVTGLGLVTSILLSPQNPQQTTTMGIGRFFGLSSSSGSSSSSQPQAGYRPPLGPGSSKADYAQDLKSSGSPVSQWPAQGYHHGEDAPPAYFPQDRPERNDWTTDFKAPLPPKVHTDVALYPAPSEIHSPGGSGGEDPLLALRNHDIVLVMDDSYSMTLVDNPGGRSRWDQVSNGSTPPPPHMGTLSSWSEITNAFA